MTRKDYILLAEVLRVEYLTVKKWKADAAVQADTDAYLHFARQRTYIYRIAEELADSLARDNGRFDREHFLAVVRGEKALESRPGRGGR